jgi:hypothetical protein
MAFEDQAHEIAFYLIVFKNVYSPLTCMYPQWIPHANVLKPAYCIQVGKGLRSDKGIPPAISARWAAEPGLQEWLFRCRLDAFTDLPKDEKSLAMAMSRLAGVAALVPAAPVANQTVIISEGRIIRMGADREIVFIQ